MSAAESPGDHPALVHHDEHTRVAAWRAERLIDLGLDIDTALQHADQLDWHDVDRLLRHGCDPRTAIAILT